MRQKALCLAAAVVLSLAATIHAAEPEQPSLPDNLLVHISAKSFVGLIENLDAAVAAVSENTTNAVPPGFLGMLVQMQLPFPIDAWKSDEPMHIVTFHEDSKEPIVLFAVESFDAFVTAFEDIGAEIEELDTDGKFGNAREIEVRGAGKPIQAVEVAEGKVAIAEDWELIARLVDAPETKDWAPAHPDDVDVNIQVDIAAALARENIFGKALFEIEQGSDEMIGDLEKAGIAPRVAQALPALLKDMMQLLGDEVNKAKSVAFKLNFDAENIIIRVSVDSQPESFLYRTGRHLAKQKRVANPLADKMSAGAVSIGINAGPEEMFPVSIEDTAAFGADLFGKVFPEKRDRIKQHFTDAWSHFQSGMVMQSYQRVDGSINVYFGKTDDSAQAVRDIVGVYTGFNEMLEEAVLDQDDSLRLIIEEGEIEGQKFTRIYPELTNPETARKVADLFKDMPGAKFNGNLGDFIRIYAAAKGDVLVLIAGFGAKDEDVLAMTRMLDNPGTPMLAADSAKQVLEKVVTGQAVIGAVDVDKFMVLLLQQIGEVSRLKHEEAFEKALARAETEFKPTGQFIGFAMGADDGRSAVEVVLPTKSINGIWRNYELFRQIMASTRMEELREQSDEIGDGEEDEDEVDIEVDEEDDGEEEA